MSEASEEAFEQALHEHQVSQIENYLFQQEMNEHPEWEQCQREKCHMCALRDCPASDLDHYRSAEDGGCPKCGIVRLKYTIEVSITPGGMWNAQSKQWLCDTPLDAMTMIAKEAQGKNYSAVEIRRHRHPENMHGGRYTQARKRTREQSGLKDMTKAEKEALVAKLQFETWSKQRMEANQRRKYGTRPKKTTLKHPGTQVLNRLRNSTLYVNKPLKTGVRWTE